MQLNEIAPELADAADVLSDQLRAHLQRMAVFLLPHIDLLERRFIAKLKVLGFEPKIRSALIALTTGAAAKILAESGLGKPFWRRLQPLLDESDPELVVHAAKLAVAAGTELDKKRTVTALLRILPDAPWYLREDAAGCLEALYYLGELLIEEEIARRLTFPPHKRAADSALIMLVHLRSHVREAQDPCLSD